MFVIASFRSRNQTMAFVQILGSYGIKTQIINTPHEVMSSCSLSVKFLKSSAQAAKEVLMRRKFDTFVGFFEVSNGTARRIL